MTKKFLSFLLLLSWIFLSLEPAFSETEEELNSITSWENLASRADEVISKSEASNEALKKMLSDLLTQRKEVYNQQVLNSTKISRFSEELEALGPPPNDGEVESLKIAERRQSLKLLLNAANVPFLAANAMLKRTDYLVSEINAILRDRLTKKLFSFAATPLDVSGWAPAMRELFGFFSRVKQEIYEIISSRAQQKLLIQKVPIFGLLIIISIALFIVYKKRAFPYGYNSRRDADYEKIDDVKKALFDGLNHIVFLTSFVVAVEALKFSGLFGFYGLGMLGSLEVFFAMLLLTRWLSENILYAGIHLTNPGEIKLKNIMQVRPYIFTLGVILSINVLFERLADVGDWELMTKVVLHFPIISAAGIFLFNLANYINRVRDNFVNQIKEEASKPNFSIAKLIVNILKLISLLSPLLALFGYYYAAQKLIFPTITTFGIIISGFFLFGVIYSVFVKKNFEEPNEIKAQENSWLAFLPITFAALISIIVVPLIGLAWGADTSDLYAIWVRMQEGIPLGSARLTLPGLISLVVVFFIGYTITRLIQRLLKANVLPKTSIDTGGQNAIVSGTGYTGIILSTMLAISSTGLDLSSLAIVAGALSVGLGFGLQTIVSNFVSGIILLIERPIKEGDWIDVAGFSGTVRKISVRSTQIQTFDRGTVIVPNSELISGSVLNYTHSNLMGRVRVPIGVSYGTDPRKVEEILLKLAEQHPQVIKKPAPSVVFMGFGADSMNFEIRAFMKDVGFILAVKSDLNYEIVKAFQKEGIEIPFPQREVTVKNLAELQK